MKRRMLFGMFISAMMICCSDDDHPPINPELNKTWEMVSYVAFMPELPRINEGDISWTIDVPNKKLTVVNKLENQHPYMRPSGAYQIGITHNNINISSTEYDYIIENDTLTLSDIGGSADGPIMKFIAK